MIMLRYLLVFDEAAGDRIKSCTVEVIPDRSSPYSGLLYTWGCYEVEKRRIFIHFYQF